MPIRESPAIHFARILPLGLGRRVDGSEEAAQFLHRADDVIETARARLFGNRPSVGAVVLPPSARNGVLEIPAQTRRRRRRAPDGSLPVAAPERGDSEMGLDALGLRPKTRPGVP